MSALPKTIKQLGMFGSGGAFAMLLNLAVTSASRELAGFSVEISYVFGFSVVLMASFVICRYAVFDAADADFRPQFLKFVLSSFLFRGAEFAACYSLYKFVELHYFVALLSVQIASFFVKFFFYRAIVFSGDDKAST